MLLVKNIDVYHGDKQTLWDVSLFLKQGEIIALLGANGAGKSTIAETIVGLNTPKKGNIIFNDMQINKKPVHKLVELGISLVPDFKGLFPDMSVFENLEMGAFNLKARKRKEKSISYVYKLFPILKERRNQIAGTLSGGEQQMLAIGMGLMSDAKVLILDEPSLGLAPRIIEEIFEAIYMIHKKGVSILLIEQNVHISLELAHRVYIIENGRITKQGETKTFLNNNQIMNAYLGIGL